MSLNDKIIIVVATAIATFIVNLIFQWLKNMFEWDVDKKKFKRERANERLHGLYLDVYKIIIQSEYLRSFLEKYENQYLPFNEYPFLELERSKTVSKGTLNRNGETITRKSEETKTLIKDSMTAFNKSSIVEKIIDNSNLASTRLIKIAVAYRFAQSNYQNDFQRQEIKDYFQEEELSLLLLMVSTIVQETNELLEICHMEYDGKEISYGLPNNSIFEKRHGD